DKEVFTLNGNQAKPATEAVKEDPLAPKLVDNSASNNPPSALMSEPEMPTNTGTPFQVNIPKPEHINLNPQGTSYYNSNKSNTFELFIREDGNGNKNTNDNQPTNSYNQPSFEPAPQQQAPMMNQPTNQPSSAITMTERYMTDAEIEEQRRFEEQKRIFEERA